MLDLYKFIIFSFLYAPRKDKMADKNNILYLFDRPTEPIFIGKGEDNVSFDVPTEYLVSYFL